MRTREDYTNASGYFDPTVNAVMYRPKVQTWVAPKPYRDTMREAQLKKLDAKRKEAEREKEAAHNRLLKTGRKLKALVLSASGLLEKYDVAFVLTLKDKTTGEVYEIHKEEVRAKKASLSI